MSYEHTIVLGTGALSGDPRESAILDLVYQSSSSFQAGNRQVALEKMREAGRIATDPELRQTIGLNFTAYNSCEDAMQYLDPVVFSAANVHNDIQRDGPVAYNRCLAATGGDLPWYQKYFIYIVVGGVVLCGTVVGGLVLNKAKGR
jgi:hypothetical protein